MSTTEDILDHHLEAFGAQNMEATLEDYADDAVVITQGETYRGPEESPHCSNSCSRSSRSPM